MGRKEENRAKKPDFTMVYSREETKNIRTSFSPFSALLPRNLTQIGMFSHADFADQANVLFCLNPLDLHEFFRADAAEFYRQKNIRTMSF